MNKKASGKESGNVPDPNIAIDDPVIPLGEELALGPVEGDEIDPLPKWWDEPIEADRGKVGNRRLEEGVEIEAPRRKALRPLPADGNGETGEEALPRAAASPDPVQAIAEAEVAAPPAGGDPSFYDLAEIDAGEIRVKRRKTGDGTEDGDLSVLFGEPGDGPAEGPSESGAKAEFPDETTKADPAPSPAGSSAPAGKGPPPMPVKFDAVFEERKPLISDPAKPVKMSPPAAVPPVAAEPKAEVPVASPAAADKVPADGGEVVATEDPCPDKPTIPVDAPVSESPEPPAPEAEPDPVQVIGGPLPKPAAAPAPAKRKAGCWTVFATLFFLATMFVVVLLGAAGAYAWWKSSAFTGELATTAKGKLAEQGIHLDYGSWSYEFPRGIVFDEITVFDDATRARPVVKASGLGVNVDLLALAKDPGSLGSAEFSLRDSSVSLYEKGELFAEIAGVEGEILADASAITIERLAATVGGLRVRLDGSVKLPDKAATSATPAAVADGAPKPSPFAALDFSGFRALQPWLDFEGVGGEAPLLTLSFAMDAAEPDLAAIEGTLGGSGLKWRGIDLTSFAAAFHVDPKAGELRFPNLQAGYGGGLVGAVLAIDMASQTLKIERLQSTVDFIAMLSAYDAAWAETFKSVRFVDAPSVVVTGEMPLGDPGNANLKIRYEQRQGLEYLEGDRTLPLSDIRGQFTYDRGALETNDAAASVFGGQLLVNGAINLLREKRPFTGLVEIAEMPLENAATWFGREKAGLSGRLFLNFRGTGDSETASINGGGNLRIEEATLPEFPVLGPVQALVGKIVPAFGATASGSVSGAYILESGVLVTSDLTVRNGGARVAVNGSVKLATNETTFVATADLEPALASATGLKDKAIVVEGAGPLDKPSLKVKQFPVEFAAAGLGEILGTTPESLGGLKEAIGSESAAEVITGSIEEATGLKIDATVTDLLKGLLGEEVKKPAPVLRAIPEN